MYNLYTTSCYGYHVMVPLTPQINYALLNSVRRAQSNYSCIVLYAMVHCVCHRMMPRGRLGYLMVWYLVVMHPKVWHLILQPTGYLIVYSTS